jgi:predicted SprT family Zn-dependent metalloprotease
MIATFLIVQSVTAYAQDQFMTPQAKFTCKLVMTKGSAYFDKNAEAECKKQGYALMTT